MSTRFNLPAGLQDARTKIETRMADFRSRANQRLSTMGVAVRLPILPLPKSNNNETTAQRISKQSQVAPFNTPGIMSNIRGFRGQPLRNRLSRIQNRRMLSQNRGQKKLHPGIVDTVDSSVERAKGAFPVSRSIAVEM